MRSIGVDIRVVGLMTLAQAPWTFKILWSPLMDRYTLPWLGRRRGWAALSQVALFALTLWLIGCGDHPDTPWVVGALALAIAFASATQDIAIDAYAVEILRPEEQGVAVGRGRRSIVPRCTSPGLEHYPGGPVFLAVSKSLPGVTLSADAGDHLKAPRQKTVQPRQRRCALPSGIHFWGVPA
jgi:hypothetical protein